MQDINNTNEQNEESNLMSESDKMLNAAGSEIANQAVQQAVSTVISSATDTALAASGVGTPVALAKKALEAGIKAFNDIDNNRNEKKKSSGFIVLFFTIFFLLYMVIHITTIQGTVGASSELYHEEQYGKKITASSSENTLSIRNFISFFYRFFSHEDTIEDYEAYKPLNKSLDKNFQIINAAFETAYEIAKIEVEEEIIEKNYDYTLTMESFYENPYPYEFENINYAELLSVISQKDEYNAENLTFKKFKQLFNPDIYNENLKYLYCMEITEETTTIIEEYEENGKKLTREKEVKYGKVVLVKYDLLSLYTMLSLDPNEFNKHYKKTRNIEMLDDQEKNIRYASNGYNFGSTLRTVYDCGIGRKGITHTESYNDYLELLKTLDIENITDAQKILLEAALSKLGTAYSQDYRNKEGYFDCSSFVAWVYRENLGITFGSVSPVAADICKYLENSNCQVSSSVDYTNIKVGDLIFYSSKTNGRYKNITHVAFYAGEGKIIDASSRKGQVVYRDIWGLDEIVSVCRPLQ